MSKSVSANLESHIAQSVTTLASCWHVTRVDGTEIFCTNHDEDLVVDGDTYVASTGYAGTAISNDSSLSVDNLEIQSILDSSFITQADLRAGLYDYAEVEIFVVNYESLADGKLKLRRGTIGEVTLTSKGIFTAELRGLTQRLAQRTGELYSPECRADLGDSRCKVPIQPDVVVRSTAYAVGDYVRVATGGAGTLQEDYENRIYKCTTAGTTDVSAPTYDTVVGNTTTDGTAVFTAVEAWTRHASVTSVTDNRTFVVSVADSRAVDDWFNGGVLVFETGDNAGIAREIKDWDQSSGTVTLYLPMPFDVAAADKARMWPGCTKARALCVSRFANVYNFRGEPDLPGQDELYKYPDAK